MTNPLTALGKWANAPLALVVAQVRFTATPETNFRIITNLMQEALGQRFPDTNNIEQVTFFVGSDGAPTIANEANNIGTDIISQDTRTCLRVQDGMLTLTTSIYHNWESFLLDWRKMLEVLCTAGPVHANRIGLRYLDFILPCTDKIPEDYVVFGIGRPPEGLEQSPISVSLYEYEREQEGRLRIQYSRGFGPPSIPPDLQGTAPPAPALLARYLGGPSAILDMDRFAMLNRQLSADQLATEFAMLRKDISSTFQRIITPFASSEWQRNTQEA